MGSTSSKSARTAAAVLIENGRPVRIERSIVWIAEEKDLFMGVLAVTDRAFGMNLALRGWSEQGEIDPAPIAMIFKNFHRGKLRSIYCSGV